MAIRRDTAEVCAVCDERSEQSQKLQCGHWLCYYCAAALVKQAIQRRFGRVLCPVMWCGATMNHHDIQTHCSERDFCVFVECVRKHALVTSLGGEDILL